MNKKLKNTLQKLSDEDRESLYQKTITSIDEPLDIDMDTVLAEYSGCVTFVMEDKFDAIVFPVSDNLEVAVDSGGAFPVITNLDSCLNQWTITFENTEVSDKDLDKIKCGALFKYRFGYRVNCGQKIKGWEIVF